MPIKNLELYKIKDYQFFFDDSQYPFVRVLEKKIENDYTKEDLYELTDGFKHFQDLLDYIGNF